MPWRGSERAFQEHAQALAKHPVKFKPPKAKRAERKKKKRRRKQRRQQQSSKSAYYAAYLKSQLWWTIRARVLKRDGNRCQACPNRARIVHHKSYAKDVMDGRNDAELVSLCHACHEDIELDFVDGCPMPIKADLARANEKLTEKISAYLDSLVQW